MTDAWHFLPADGMTRYEPRVRVVIGETLRVDPPVIICSHGLHGSIRAIDALQYAPGPIVCRTRHTGEIAHGDDKIVSSERTALWMYDATSVLHKFACCVAETALLIGKVDDARCWGAIEAKRAWLRGEVNDAQLAAAWDVAWDAARAATRDAAWAAARAAAWDVAWDVAWDAAWAAARAAAWDVAWDATRAAAWDATRAAAWDEQNALLEAMLTEGRP